MFGWQSALGLLLGSGVLVVVSATPCRSFHRLVTGNQPVAPVLPTMTFLTYVENVGAGQHASPSLMARKNKQK